MKKAVFFLAAIAAVAALACYFTLSWSQHRITADDVTSHEWLHHELAPAE